MYDWLSIYLQMQADPVGVVLLRFWEGLSARSQAFPSTIVPSGDKSKPSLHEDERPFRDNRQTSLVSSNEVMQIAIDLEEVRNLPDFLNTMRANFPVGIDRREIWEPIYWFVANRRQPMHIVFTGWENFSMKMPRYARRLKRLLPPPERQHSFTTNLRVDYHD